MSHMPTIGMLMVRNSYPFADLQFLGKKYILWLLIVCETMVNSYAAVSFFVYLPFDKYLSKCGILILIQKYNNLSFTSLSWPLGVWFFLIFFFLYKKAQWQLSSLSINMCSDWKLISKAAYWFLQSVIFEILIHIF